MANEFDDIFKDAADSFKPQAPKGLRNKILHELNLNRGFRQLNWIWPLRVALGMLFTYVVGLNLVQNYDALEIVESPPIDYEALAIEMNLLNPIHESPSSKQSSANLGDDKNSNLLGKALNEGNSKPVDFIPLTQIEKNRAGQHFPLDKESANYRGEGTLSKEEVLTMNTLPISKGLVDDSIIRIQSLLSTGYLISDHSVKNEHSRFFFKLSGFGQMGNPTFLAAYDKSVYSLDNPSYDYLSEDYIISSTQPSSQLAISADLGLSLSKYVDVYSGVRYNFSDGTRTVVSDVEEQFTFSRTVFYPTPEGSMPIKVEEQVVQSTLLRDTLVSRYQYSTISIPFGIQLRVSRGKWQVTAGPQIGLDIGQRYELRTTSSQFADIQNSILIQNSFTPTSYWYGMNANVGFQLLPQMHLLITGEVARQNATGRNVVYFDSFNAFRAGLALRYNL